MDLEEIRKKSLNELDVQLNDLVFKYLNLKVRIKCGQSKEFHLLKRIRKDIARIHMFLDMKRKG